MSFFGLGILGNDRAYRALSQREAAGSVSSDSGVSGGCLPWLMLVVGHTTQKAEYETNSTTITCDCIPLRLRVGGRRAKGHAQLQKRRTAAGSAHLQGAVWPRPRRGLKGQDCSLARYAPVFRAALES